MTKNNNITGLSAARGYLAAASTTNYAVFGGGNASGTVDAYNASLTRTIAPSMVGNKELAATKLGEFAIFGGGTSVSNSTASNVVTSYDDSLTKTELTSLTTARGNLGAATIGNYAIFAGGGTSATAEAYTL